MSTGSTTVDPISGYTCEETVSCDTKETGKICARTAVPCFEHSDYLCNVLRMERLELFGDAVTTQDVEEKCATHHLSNPQTWICVSRNQTADLDTTEVTKELISELLKRLTWNQRSTLASTVEIALKTEHSCSCFLIMMSHGSQGERIESRSSDFPSDDIGTLSDCMRKIHTPKMIMIKSCHHGASIMMYTEGQEELTKPVITGFTPELVCKSILQSPLLTAVQRQLYQCQLTLLKTPCNALYTDEISPLDLQGFYINADTYVCNSGLDLCAKTSSGLSYALKTGGLDFFQSYDALSFLEAIFQSNYSTSQGRENLRTSLPTSVLTSREYMIGGLEILLQGCFYKMLDLFPSGVSELKHSSAEDSNHESRHSSQGKTLGEGILSSHNMEKKIAYLCSIYEEEEYSDTLEDFESSGKSTVTEGLASFQVALNKNSSQDQSSMNEKEQGSDEHRYQDQVQQTIVEGENAESVSNDSYACTRGYDYVDQAENIAQFISTSKATCETPNGNVLPFHQTKVAEISVVDGPKKNESDPDSAFPRDVQSIIRGQGLFSHVTVSKVPIHKMVTALDMPEQDLKCKYRSETERLMTFMTGFNSHHMTASSLARAGFINSGKGTDEVYCLWCEVQLCHFKSDMDASALHQAISGTVCELIVYYKEINIPLSSRPRHYLETASTQGAPGRELSLESGYFSNPSIAAAQALTLNETRPNSAENEQGVSAGGDFAERYIQFEKRTEGFATALSVPPPQQQRLSSKSLAVPDVPMRHELCRLESFIKNDWSRVHSKHLAWAGFYLIRDTPEMFTLACPFCDNKINGVAKDTMPMFTKEKDHTPLEVHTLKFPACPFVQGTKLGPKGNVPILSEDFRWEKSKVVTAVTISVSDLEDVGIATVHAKHPPMAVLDRRMESFLTVSYDHPKGAEELSSAGFFFEGKGDSVTCFWCGIVCGNWSVAEDAWIRHARSSRSCQFVLNEKGSEFIGTAIEEHGLWAENHRDEDRIRNVTTRMIRPRMDATVVQTVIGMGYSREHVKTAVINRLKKLKPDYKQTEDLVSDVLELKYKDMKYNRKLLLPDIQKMPVSSLPDPEAEVENNGETQVQPGTEALPPSDPPPGLSEPVPPSEDPPASKSVQDLSDGERVDLSKQMMNQLTCKICISSAVGIIFLPCAHLVCCTSCAAAMTQCPICRQDIAGTIKANV